MITSHRKMDLSKTSAQGKRVAVVASRYYEEIVDDLLKGALSTLESLGAKASDLSTVWVPGSFEIPLAARAIAQHQQVDAIICLGVVIKGETRHDEYIAREVAHGIAQIGHQSGIPVVLGVLTTETVEQARARAGGPKGNKGAEAAETAVAMIQVLEAIKKGAKKPAGGVGFGVP